MRFAGNRGKMAGFTLLEVLVALAVLAIAVTVILQLFSANLRALSVSGGMTSAAAKGESKMREILSEPSLTETVRSEAMEDGYRMDVSISEVLKERTDTLPVKMMEVILTVRWIEGGRERHIDLRTMKMVERTAAEKV